MWSLAASALLLACPDPGGDFDAFTRRAGKRDAGSQTESCEQTDGDLPEPEQLSGQFLLSVSTTLGPDQPFLYLLDVSTERTGSGYSITMSAQPLSASDRKTPVGDASEPQTFSVEEGGCFESPPTMFTVPGPANPILPVQATSELSFAGSVGNAIRQSAGDQLVTFWCGNVNGRSLTPLPMNVDGSTFAATRVEDPDNLPPVVINCAMDPARPL